MDFNDIVNKPAELSNWISNAASSASERVNSILSTDPWAIIVIALFIFLFAYIFFQWWQNR